MSIVTCVNERLGEAPGRRVLRGDRKHKTEPATHIIEFPGGAVEVSRLDDGTYWAHIIVNRGQVLPNEWAGGLGAAHGVVVASRVDWAERGVEAIPSLPDEAQLRQIAVRIAPELPA